jgi:hypothetical protein
VAEQVRDCDLIGSDKILHLETRQDVFDVVMPFQLALVDQNADRNSDE